jgi:hypothetical protein
MRTNRTQTTNALRPAVYVVEVALARADGSRTYDSTWVVASGAEQAGRRALVSAARRWPAHTPLEVVSARVDHSRRAARFLSRALAEQGAPTAPAPAVHTEPEIGHAETPASEPPPETPAETLIDRMRATYEAARDSLGR